MSKLRRIFGVFVVLVLIFGCTPAGQRISDSDAGIHRKNLETAVMKYQEFRKDVVGQEKFVRENVVSETQTKRFDEISKDVKRLIKKGDKWVVESKKAPIGRVSSFVTKIYGVMRHNVFDELSFLYKKLGGN